MKKLTVLCFAWMLVLSVVGCSQTRNAHPEDKPHMITGTVQEVYDKMLLIEGGKEVYPQGTKFYVPLDTESKDGLPHFSVGDEVIVYYDGMIQETYPAQIPTVYEIVLKTTTDRG